VTLASAASLTASAPKSSSTARWSASA